MQHLVCLLISDGFSYWYGYFTRDVHIIGSAYQKGPWTLQIGSALLVSGAIGNGMDRCMLHGVVDF